MNAYLKDLGKMAELNDIIIIKRLRQGKIEEKHYKKYELLSTHCAQEGVLQQMLIWPDNSGKIYITGSSLTDSLNLLNYYTIKYDTAGTIEWSIAFDGDKHLNDRAVGIALDDNGDVIVSGASETAPGTFEYATVKYVEKNVITPTDNNSEIASFSYYENKGQLLNMNDTLIPNVRYYTTSTTPAYFVGNKNLSFVYSHIDTIPATSDTVHRIDLNFTGAKVNANAKVYPMETQKKYINYFLGHIPDGITEIHGNKRLVTSDLYSNIDLEYSSNQNGFKYYFIIKQGGDPTDINMEFTGASSFNLNGTTNDLTINSPIGSITFDRPSVYQLSSTHVIIPITGWTADWQTNGASNKYKFNIGTYDNTKVLVIEVDLGNGTNSATSIGNLEWSTLYGGSNGEAFYDVTTDLVGNSYVSGVSSSTDFPVTTGTVQGTLTLDQDVVVVKFDRTTLDNTWATLLWWIRH